MLQGGKFNTLCTHTKLPPNPALHREFWWPGFPALVYFKETQTKPEGQIHFFPILMDGKQLYDVMSERCGPSKTSGPKGKK
jgi:hypothetical protein